MQIDKNEVLRYLGYKPGHTKANTNMLDKIDYYAALGVTLLEPNTSYRIFSDLSITEAGVQINDVPLLLPGQDITNLLKQAKKVCIVAATIGPQLEQRVAELFKQDEYAAATILDAVGSDAVEKVADQLQQQLGNIAKRQGLEVTWRYCSGYGDLPLQVNSQLASVTNASNIGITVTTTHMLLPQKSMLGIVGFNLPGVDTPLMNKCALCKAENCAYRNRSDQCAKSAGNG